MDLISEQDSGGADLGYRALVVDDEAALADVVASYLHRDHFEVTVCHTGAEALAVAREVDPDVVVLDLGLPGIDGLEVCRQLRTFSDAYVVMLTARDTEMDTIVGLSVGADDYVTKPFSVRELLLRIKAILRRRAADPGNSAEEAQFERLRVDLEGHQVWIDEQRVTLTALEFRLLATLIARRGRVQTRDMLLNDVWGVQVDVTTRTVDTHVQRLRKKLGDAGNYIETLRGVGYRFLVPDGSPSSE